jgi:hypothetical protein
MPEHNVGEKLHFFVNFNQCKIFCLIDNYELK